jgi:hypothetical protein
LFHRELCEGAKAVRAFSTLARGGAKSGKGKEGRKEETGKREREEREKKPSRRCTAHPGGKEKGKEEKRDLEKEEKRLSGKGGNEPLAQRRKRGQRDDASAHYTRWGGLLESV